MNRLEWCYVPKVRFKNNSTWFYLDNTVIFDNCLTPHSECALRYDCKGDAYSQLLDAVFYFLANRDDYKDLIEWRVVHCQVGDLFPIEEFL